MFPSFILLLLLLLLLFLAPPALTTPTSLQVRGHRTPRETKPDSIKVVISEGVVSQGDSADVSHGGREIDLTPGSPLVLTHKINLVSSGPGLRSGSCGCDLDLAALKERLERLEREVSTLRERCGADGGCTSKESKGPGSSIKPGTECPNECSDQGRCVDGVCVCFPGFSAPDCSQSNCPGNCNDRGRCVNGQCVCDPGFTAADCSQTGCPDDCNRRGKCVNGRCVCDGGFSGPSCSEASCLGNCNGRGRCQNGKCACNPGFTGPDCSKRACPNNCSNRGRCVSGKCVCNSGFTGTDCSEASCPGNCNRRGRCVNGKCVCDNGFTGTDCSERTCPNDCSGRGKCVNGKCVCDGGFTGTDCSERACPGNCNGRGRCEDGKCACNPGFTGPDCSKRACPNDCSNRGKCVNGACVCNPGFTGTDCSDKTCPNDCSGRGRCVNGKCECYPGFTGTDCSERSCPNDCSDRGKCVDGICVCDDGFTGTDCSERSCPNDCSNRGKCVDGKCVCDDGFTATDCSERSCPKDCSGRGKCVDGKCVCDNGFTGTDCSERSCLNDCSDRGKCVDGTCVCDDGFTGTDCSEVLCPGNCNSRGRCVDGKCVCDNGFTGTDCSERSCPKDCSDRGRCVNGKCVCDDGFTGTDCSEVSCPGNCNKRGRCEDGQCICNAGFTGPDCSKRACPNDCSGRGRCVGGKCVCDSNSTGPDCSKASCPGNCNKRGRCEDGRCVCNAGFSGTDCSVRACPKDCSGNGKCVAGKCVCHAGFTGPVCGAKTCPENCSNRGRCIKAQCVCRPGFTGPDCSQCEDGKTGPNCETVMSGVSQLNIRGITETSVTVEWTRPPVQYEAYDIVFTSKKDIEQPVRVQADGDRTSFTQTGLASGQDFTVSVTGRLHGRHGAPSAADFTTLISGPSDLRVVKTTSTSAVVQWAESQGEVDRYRLTVTPNDGAGDAHQVTVPAGRDSAHIQQLEAGRLYDVSLVAEKSSSVSEAATTQVTPGKIFPTVTAAATTLASELEGVVDRRQAVNPSPELQVQPRGEDGESGGSREDSTTSTIAKTKPLISRKPGVNGTRPKVSERLTLYRRPEVSGPSRLNATRVASGGKKLIPLKKKPPVGQKKKPIVPKKPKPAVPKADGTTSTRPQSVAASSTDESAMTSGTDSDTKRQRSSGEPAGAGGSKEQPDVGTAGQGNNTAPVSPAPTRSVQSQDKKCLNKVKVTHLRLAQRGRGAGCQEDGTVLEGKTWGFSETDDAKSSSEMTDLDYSSEPLHELLIDTSNKMNITTFAVYVSKLSTDFVSTETVKKPSSESSSSLAPPPTEPPSRSSSSSSSSSTTAASTSTSSPPSSPPTTTADKSGSGRSNELDIENGKSVTDAPEVRKPPISGKGVAPIFQRTPGKPVFFRRPHPNLFQNRTRLSSKVPPRLTPFPRRETETELSSSPTSSVDFSEPMRDANGDGALPPTSSGVEQTQKKMPPGRGRLPIRRLPPKPGSMLRRPNLGLLQNRTRPNLRPLPPPARPSNPASETRREQETPTEFLATSPSRPAEGSGPVVAENGDRVGTGLSSANNSTVGIGGSRAPFPQRPTFRRPPLYGGRILNGNRTNLRPPQYPHRGPPRKLIPTRKLNGVTNGVQIRQSEETPTDNVLENQSGGPDSSMPTQVVQIQQRVTPGAQLEGQDTTRRPQIHQLEGVDSSPIQTTKTNGQDSNPDVHEDGAKRTGATSRATSSSVLRHDARKPFKPAEQDTVGVTPSSRLEGQDTTIRPFSNELEGLGRSPIQTTKSTETDGQDFNSNVHEDRASVGENAGATSPGRPTIKQTSQKPAEQDTVAVTPSSHSDGQDTTVKPPINELEGVDSGPTRSNGQDLIPEVPKKKPIVGKNAGATIRGRPTIKQTFKKPFKPAKQDTVGVTPSAQLEEQGATVRPQINEQEGPDSAPVQTRPNGQDPNPDIQKKKPIAGKNAGAINRGRPTIKQTSKKLVKPAKKHTVAVTPSAHTDGQDTTIKPPINDLEGMDSALVQTRSNGQDPNPQVQKKKPIAGKNAGAINRGRPMTKQTSKKLVKPVKKHTVAVTPSAHINGQDTTIKPPIHGLEGPDSAPVQTRPNSQDSNPEVQKERPIAGKNTGATSQGTPTIKQTSKKPVKPATQDTEAVTPSAHIDGQDTTIKPPIDDLEGVESSPVQNRPDGHDSNPDIQKKKPIAGKNAGATSQGRPMTKQTSKKPVKPATQDIVAVTPSAHTDGQDTTIKPPIHGLEGSDSAPVQTRPNGQDSNPEVQKERPIAGKNTGATSQGTPTIKQTSKKPVKPAVTPSAHIDGPDTTIKPPINDLEGSDSGLTRSNGQDPNPQVQKERPIAGKNTGATSQGRPMTKQTSKKLVKPATQDTEAVTPSAQLEEHDATLRPQINEQEGPDRAPVQTRPNGQDSNPEVQKERPNPGATSRGSPTIKQTSKKPVKPATQDTVAVTPSAQLEEHDATLRPQINEQEGPDSAPVQTRPNGQDSNLEERPIAGKNAGATSRGRPMFKQTPVGSRPVKPLKKPPATRTITPQHQMRPNGGIKLKNFIKPNATRRLLDGRREQSGSPESKPQPGSGVPSPGVTREPLDHVGVTNRTSDGFTLVWDSPEDKYKNFVVTSKEVGKHDKPEKKKRPEGFSDEGHDAEETGNRIPGGGAAPQDPGVEPLPETDQTFKKVLPGSARAFQFENLPSLSKYTVTLLGKSSGVLSRLHKLVISTGPEPPTDIVFSDLTEDSVTVSWTKPRSAVGGFKVTYTGRADGEPVSVSVGAGDSDLGLTRLAPGSTYEVSVVSIHGLDESDPAHGHLTTRPDPPTDLRILNVTDSSAVLSWRPSKTVVDKYTIVYGSGTSAEVRVTVSGDSAGHSLDALEPSTTYKVRVSSSLEELDSPHSSSSFTTTDSVVDDDGPRDLQAVDVTPRTARLSWKPPLAPPPGYRLTYQSEGQEVKEVMLDGGVKEVELNRLHPGEAYTATLQPEGGGAGGAGGAGGGAETAISTSFTTGALRFPFPSDCSEEFLNGMRSSAEVDIFPAGKLGKTLRVSCDMETDGGGWTVFQRRMDGSEDFFRGWKDYTRGFGNVSREFWLGLENLQDLTSRSRMTLRVDLRDGDDSAFAKYSVFQVAKRNYRLVVGGYSGTAGDSLTYHDQQVFSTRDRDVSSFITHCPMSYRGGWWYKNCHEANLNGLYGTARNQKGIIWTAWRGKQHSVPFVEMKMRPLGFRG